MYGDPSHIRQIAVRLERRADDLRAEAEALQAASERVAWVSVAADSMRARAGEQRDRLRAVAVDYDEAADRVRRHAAEVQRLLDLIASIERQATSIVDAAADRVRGTLADLAHGVKDVLTPGDEEDRRLVAIALPPPGHLDWLDVPDLIPEVRL